MTVLSPKESGHVRYQLVFETLGGSVTLDQWFETTATAALEADRILKDPRDGFGFRAFVIKVWPGGRKELRNTLYGPSCT